MRKELMEKRLAELKNAGESQVPNKLTDKGLRALKICAAFSILCVYGIMIKNIGVPYKILRLTSVSKYR